MAIKHLSFDLWMCLIKSNPDYKMAKAFWLKDFLTKNNIQDSLYVEYVKNKIKIVGKQADFASEHMGITYKPEHIILNLLDHLVDNEVSDKMEVIRAIQRGFDGLILKHCPVLIDPDTVSILQGLKSEGYTLNVASNTGFTCGETMDKVLDQLGIFDLFDFRLYSEQMGVSKPNPVFFANINKWYYNQSLLCPLVNEVLHIGDNDLADGLGAIGYGFKSLIINSNNNTLNDLLTLLKNEKRDVLSA